MSVRNINVVLQTIRKEIPPNFSSIDLESFDRLIEDVKYKDSEQWREYWGRAGSILKSMLGRPDTQWKERISDIIEDRVDVLRSRNFQEENKKFTPYDFYLVWRPGGHSPTHRHLYQDEAQEEAKRLAKLHPNEKFYVLHAICEYQIKQPISYTLLNPRRR